jgi:aminoglycoside/choline kinase family phosphotransferase
MTAADCPLTHQDLQEVLSSSTYKLMKLRGDGSQKNFYRLWCSQKRHSFIIMKVDDKRQSTNYQHWVSIHQTLKQNHILCPQIIEKFEHKNTLIIEDCGSELLSDKITHTNMKQTIQYLKDGTSMIKKIFDNPDSGKQIFLEP